MAARQNRENDAAPRKKHWLSGTGIAAGALMGLMAGLFFLLKGWATWS